MMRLGTVAALLLCLAVPVWAHPHVWIDVKAEVLLGRGHVDGVWTEWTFDEMFSQVILADGDPSSSGTIDEKANAVIKKGYFDNLKNFDYFTHFSVGSRELPVPGPQQFKASINPQGRVVYRFFVPVSASVEKTTFSVSFYDDSFFTDMVFIKTNPVLLTVSGGKASVALKPDKSKTYYGGSVTPVFAVVTWSPS